MSVNEELLCSFQTFKTIPKYDNKSTKPTSQNS